MLTLVSLFFLSLTSSALASSSCVAFDSSWNLYAFGFNGKDYNAGTQDSWASGTASDITASGRPPFDGTNTTCYLSQFYNAIYFMNADSSNPSTVYIYDAGGKSWSTQSIQTGSFDPSNFVSILDHDTNVFYAISNEELFFLSFENITTKAQSDPISWTDVQKPSFDTTNYQPVMALAQNHIHFLDVPGVAAGSADIFVIHFSYFQPESQPFGNFPAEHGQTASIFMSEANQVQQEFAFIPDDGSATYIINVESNTTQSMAGPSTKDSSAMYFASDSAIVQLTSSGAVNYIAYNANDSSANSAASWTSVKALASVAPTSSASGSATGTASSHSASGTSSSGSSGSSSSGNSSSSTNGAVGVAAKSQNVVLGMTGALVLGTIALFLS